MIWFWPLMAWLTAMTIFFAGPKAIERHLHGFGRYRHVIGAFCCVVLALAFWPALLLSAAYHQYRRDDDAAP